MFIACPHCQFLIARDPQSGASPADCPRCGKPCARADEATAGAPSLATLLHAAPLPAEPVHIETPANGEATADVPPAVAVEAPALAAQPSAPAEQADTGEVPAASADETAREAAIATSRVPPPGVAPLAVIETAATAPRPASTPTGPRFLQRARTTPVHARRARLQWLVVAVLSVLLCIQVVVADRARLAMQAGWRPIVTGLCGVFRCDVPTWREPAAFTMLSRDVRPLLDAPGTLQAQATFRNEARWAQAWPVILLTLKDADGRTLGARALQPSDYLPTGEKAEAIGPGQSAQMAIRIREPSASVVAFSFDFR